MMPSVTEYLVREFLNHYFISNKNAFQQGVQQLITLRGEDPAFKENFPTYQDFNLTNIDFSNPALIEKLISWWNVDTRRATNKSLIDNISELSQLSEDAIHNISAERIKEYALLIKQIVTPSLAQGHMIKGANQINAHFKLDLPDLHSEGVCSELSGLWLDAMMDEDPGALHQFKETIQFLTSYQNRQVEPTPSQLQNINVLMQKLIDTSPLHQKGFAQNNYRKIRNMTYESVHVLVANNVAQLKEVLRKVITSRPELATQTGKAYRISANGHTITILDKDNKLYFFDSNHPSGELEFSKINDELAHQLLQALTDEKGVLATTYTVNVYPLTASNNQYVNIRQADFTAALEAIKQTPAARDVTIAHYLTQYEEGEICQTHLLEKILRFFGIAGKEGYQQQKGYLNEFVTVFAEAAFRFLEEKPFAIMPSNRTKVSLPVAAKVMQEAAKAGSYQTFVQFGENPRYFQYALANKLPLLQKAVIHGHSDIVGLLLANKFPLISPIEESLLALAITKKQSSIAHQLILAGSDVNEKIKIYSDDAEKKTLLECAARNGQLDVMLDLLHHGADFPSLENGVCPVVSTAVKNGHLDIVQWFLTHHLERCHLDSLLQVAALVDNVDIFHLLRQYGADVNVKIGDLNYSIAHLAASENKLSILQYLQQNPELIAHDGTNGVVGDSLRVTDANGRLPLHFAAKNGHEKIVEFYLQAGVDPLSVDINGRTPLYYTVTNTAEVRTIATIELLFAASPESLLTFRISDKNILEYAIGHCNAIDILSEFDRYYPASELYNWIEEKCLLDIAIERGNLGALNYLLQHHYQNLTPEQIKEYLVLAAQNKQSTIFLELLSKWLSPPRTLQELVNDSQLMQKIIECNASVLSLFVELEALPLVDANGRTLLHHTCIKKNLDGARYLLQSDADINAKDRNGYTPLHFVMARKATQLLPVLLLEYKADVNATNNQGDTPLHVAWDNKKEDIIALLDAGALLNCQNNAGHTPLHKAIQYDKVGTVKVLLERGADIHLKDGQETSPLNLARTKGNPRIINLLATHERRLAIKRQQNPSAWRHVPVGVGAALCVLGGLALVSLALFPNPITALVGLGLMTLGAAALAGTAFIRGILHCISPKTQEVPADEELFLAEDEQLDIEPQPSVAPSTYAQLGAAYFGSYQLDKGPDEQNEAEPEVVAHIEPPSNAVEEVRTLHPGEGVQPTATTSAGLTKRC